MHARDTGIVVDSAPAVKWDIWLAGEGPSAIARVYATKLVSWPEGGELRVRLEWACVSNPRRSGGSFVRKKWSRGKAQKLAEQTVQAGKALIGGGR